MGKRQSESIGEQLSLFGWQALAWLGKVRLYRRERLATPEKEFFFALLELSIMDAIRPNPSDGLVAHRTALEWFESRSNEFLTFHYACWVLGLGQETIRQLIRRFTNERQRQGEFTDSEQNECTRGLHRSQARGRNRAGGKGRRRDRRTRTKTEGAQCLTLGI